MTEVSSNIAVENLKTVNVSEPKQGAGKVQHAPVKKDGADVFWAKEKKKNTGLIERLYNAIKNATGLGVGSKRVEKELEKVKNGQISKKQFIKTVKDYNTSQENSAQVLGDLFSVGAAGLTYFGLRNEAKLHHAGKQLNEKFGKTTQLDDFVKNAGAGFNWKTVKNVYGRVLAYSAKSKTKLAVMTAGIAAFVGGLTKLQVIQLNRIGSQEFKTNKKDFRGAVNPYDKAAYKINKKMQKDSKRNSNIRALISGAINGVMMPLAVVGGAFVGIPAYLVGNSLNRYFVGQKHSEKTLDGYVDSLTNDGVTNAALAAATLIPMAKKGRFSAEFDKNLKIAFDEINANNVLKENPYRGKSAYSEINKILFESPKIKQIIEEGRKEGGIGLEEQIRALSDENIFALKLKQIDLSSDSLSEALREDCPATRTLEEAIKEIQDKLGKGYKVKVNMGTGTIAETYLAVTPDGKDVCIKMLKKGIDAKKIADDKQKIIDIINGLDKTAAEKNYLIKNVENLSEGISKEIDFVNEMDAANKLVGFTKTAKVVKPIEVKDGLYIMEKADGMSLSKLLKTLYPERYIEQWKNAAKKAKTASEKAYYQKKIDELRSMTRANNKILTEKDADYMIDEYLKVLIEQLYKTDKSGRTLHADIHPGNIFIDINAIKARKGKAFTLIDTGNTIDLTAEQAERSMKLTQYLEHGDTKDLAKYFIEDANLSESKLTKEEAEKKLEEALNEVFFSSDVRLNTMTNSEIIRLTSNIMKKYNIMPGDTQLNLQKARLSAANSYTGMLYIWADQAGESIASHDNKFMTVGDAILKLRKLANKLSEYQELQQEQERKNLWQMIKSPKEFFRSQLNPNYKEKNSKDYIIYHLKQDIKNN